MKNGKKALVTGITGFIGSHLVRRLLADGWEVHGLTLPEADRSLLKGLADRLHLHAVDGATESLMEQVRGIQPDLTFHLASLFLAKHQSKDVTALIQSNVLFGTQLAEALVACGSLKLVNVGTSWQHYDSDEYSPVALYSATKQAYQDILKFYHVANGLSVVNLKFFDTYGPGDPRRKVLNIIRNAANSGESIGMTGGEQLIDLVYVDDIVEALMTAGQRASSGEARFESFAVASGRVVSIRELVAVYEGVTGKKLKAEWGVLPYREREMMRPWSAGPVLPEWKPRVTLEEGLRRVEEHG